MTRRAHAHDALHTNLNPDPGDASNKLRYANVRQIKLLDYLRQSKGGIGNHEYQSLFRVSKRTASNDLAELVAHGLLTVEGAGPATRYQLSHASI